MEDGEGEGKRRSPLERGRQPGWQQSPEEMCLGEVVSGDVEEAKYDIHIHSEKSHIKINCDQ